MYINSNIPWVADEKKFIHLIELLYKVGYQGAIINFNSISEFKDYKKSCFYPKIKTNVKFPIIPQNIIDHKSELLKIPLIPRITIEADNENKLKRKLSEIKDYNCLISVDSVNQQVLEIAARDGRVDLLNISSINHIKSLTKGIVSLCKQNRCILDLNTSLLFLPNNYQRSRIFREIYKLFMNYKPYTHTYSFGSFSEIHDHPWLVRGPIEIMHSISCLFNIPLLHVKKILGHNAEQIALRFIKRKYNIFIEPEVEIVDIKEHGKDE